MSSGTRLNSEELLVLVEGSDIWSALHVNLNN